MINNYKFNILKGVRERANEGVLVFKYKLVERDATELASSTKLIAHERWWSGNSKDSAKAEYFRNKIGTFGNITRTIVYPQ